MGRIVILTITILFIITIITVQLPVDGRSAKVISVKAKAKPKPELYTIHYGDPASSSPSKRLTGPSEIPRSATTLEEFIAELKEELDKRALPDRVIDFLFTHGSFVLQCYGEWMEFGVFEGGSITLAANWRREYCGPDAAPVYGFDTFTGLPENWEQGDGGQVFAKGRFSQEGKFPPVPENAQLIKGLFADTLPELLARLRNGQWVSGDLPLDDQVTYVHIDCDLYQGAIQALTLLTPRIRRGTVLLFDDLINYNRYREHEMRALWEWLASTGHRLRVIGAKGPISPERPKEVMDPNPTTDIFHHQQSVAFIVV